MIYYSAKTFVASKIEITNLHKTVSCESSRGWDLYRLKEGRKSLNRFVLGCSFFGVLKITSKGKGIELCWHE